MTTRTQITISKMMWNYVLQKNEMVNYPATIKDQKARELIPQTPRAQACYDTARISYNQTPYEAVQTTLKTIFRYGEFGNGEEKR